MPVDIDDSRATPMAHQGTYSRIALIAAASIAVLLALAALALESSAHGRPLPPTSTFDNVEFRPPVNGH
jgi:hypothetical protein